MATSIYSAGALLATIFEPRNGSAARANTNVLEDGTDISTIFYDQSLGGTAPPTTGILVGGADLSTLFAELGSLASPPNATMPANYTTAAFKAFSGTARAELIMEIDGDVIERKNSGGKTDKGDWTDDNSSIVAADWEVQVTKTGDTVGGSALGSYLLMSTERNWYVDESGPGNASSNAVLTVTIREVANTSNNATATITLDAEFAA